MPTVILPPSDVFHNCFALFEYTRRAHYKMYVYELPAELTLAFLALPIGVGACFLSWDENKSINQYKLISCVTTGTCLVYLHLIKS